MDQANFDPSHRHCSQTPEPILMSFQIYLYVHEGSRQVNLVWINSAVTAVCIVGINLSK